MNVEECIKNRRSIRKFTVQKVAKEVIEHVVELATYAPTWKNTQTNRYIAVTNREIINQIAEECTMNFGWNAKIIQGAQALMVLTTVEKRSGFEKDGTYSTRKGTHWQSFDAGIAAQTFCLAAHSVGLGTVIMGIYDEEKICKMLAVPDTESISALIAVGYPAEVPELPKRKEVKEILSYR